MYPPATLADFKLHKVPGIGKFTDTIYDIQLPLLSTSKQTWKSAVLPTEDSCMLKTFTASKDMKKSLTYVLLLDN